MAFDFRRPPSRGYGGNPIGSPSLGYRRPSDRQPGIEQANNMRTTTYGYGGGSSPMRRSLSRLGDLPGAKPPPHMMDQLGDMFGFGDRRKERYIAETQGGHQGIGSLPKRGISEIWNSNTPTSDEIWNSNTPTSNEIMPYMEQSAVDPSDWRTWEKIILSGGNPDDYEVTGIMGAMPEERQMAELTEDQMNMMGNPLNTPDFGVSKEDLWNRVKDMEDKGFFGWGAQEPTTQEEYDDYYRQLQEGSVGNWVT